MSGGASSEDRGLRDVKAARHGGSGRVRSQSGAALVFALVALGVVSSIGGALLLLATLDYRLAAAERWREATAAAAVAAAELGIAALAGVPDWSSVLAGVVPLPGADPSPVLTVFGRRLELAALARERQAMADSRAGGQPDDPQWRVLGWGRLDALTGPTAPTPELLLVVWVADDREDGDGDPWRDANGRVIVLGEAYGPGRARAAWSAVVRREPHGVALVAARLPAEWTLDR